VSTYEFFFWLTLTSLVSGLIGLAFGYMLGRLDCAAKLTQRRDEWMEHYGSEDTDTVDIVNEMTKPL